MTKSKTNKNYGELLKKKHWQSSDKPRKKNHIPSEQTYNVQVEKGKYCQEGFLKEFKYIEKKKVNSSGKRIIIDNDYSYNKKVLLLEHPNEEESLPSLSMHSSNRINANIQFILKEESTIIISDVSVKRFPWLYNERKDFIQDQLNKYIKDQKTNKSLYKINCLNVENYIKNILAQDLNKLDYNIYFHFVSEWIDYFGKAKENFSISPEINYIEFDEELKRSSNKITKIKCDTSEFILSHCIDFYKIKIKTNSRGWLTSLKVYIDDERNPVINQERPTQIEKKDTYYNLYVNNISLKDYKRLKGKKSKLRFEFNFEKNTINYFIDAKYEPTSIPSDDNLVNLFMDMGSTYTKYIVAQSNMNGDILKMRRCIGPKPTSTYCESISVDFNKKERVAAGTEAFGQWLVQSLRKISQEHHKRGEIIHSVIWSFPDIDGTLDQDFYLKASNIVNSHTNAFIYDKFMLIPEHESLKSMFDHILKTLAKVGRNEIDLIKQKNTVNRNKYNNSLHRYREYNNKWWLTKLFIEKVYDPGKLKQITIPEYYRKYLKMGCVDGLKNFIILDAGGYSLDVYGEIGTEFIKKSFETGGQQLTQQLEEVMLSENNDNDAEQEKIRSCQHGACREYSENCKKWTIEIYQPCIDKIYKFISDNLKKSSAEGVSMVLTGQAFKNIYLHDFVIEKLNKYTIGSQTSSNISNVIKSNTELLEDTYLSLFYSITCKNEPQNLNPKNDLDIAGGSLFRHLELHKEFVL